jgi:Fe2+ or Zn2+ uptake regulation protein
MSQDLNQTHNQLLQRMKVLGLRLTKPRVAMAGLITLWGRPFTSIEIIEDLNRSGLGVHRATVFRDLTTMVRSGVLREVQVTGKKGRHFMVAHERSGHMLVCEQCGRVVAADKGEILPVLKQWTELSPIAQGWKIRGHEVETYGVCPTCLAGAKRIHVE